MDDTVTVLLQYPGGVHGSFTCSITAQLSNTAYVSGTKGMAQVRRRQPSWDGALRTGWGHLWLLELEAG